MKKFPSDIYLKDNWIVWELEQFQEGLRNYRKELNKLEEMSCSYGIPVPVETFIMDYPPEDELKYYKWFWATIHDYVKEKESEDWVFSHLDHTEGDTNTDPYDDYELLSSCYTVYASIKNEDITQTLEYKQQEKLVQHYLDEVLRFKTCIDGKI